MSYRQAFQAVQAVGTARRTVHPKLFTPQKNITSHIKNTLLPSIPRQHTQFRSMCTSTPQREVLPTNVKPLRYELSLEPDFSDFTFLGQLAIDLDVNETTSVITLNSLEIDIHDAFVNDVAVSKISYDEPQQTASFELAQPLAPQTKATLSMSFTGLLNDKMAGFYRSSYTDESGNTAYLATTQMEPTDCRRAFPSFDEPALKAKFDISLISDSKLVHLSNMDEKSVESLDGGKKKTIFNTTPLMSTYLVAFIVGDLRCVENHNYSKPIKVWATPGSEHLGEYSADIAAKTLKFFDSKFDIPYPLPKLDMVAIHDFLAGAMENFGLITYRTVDLLLDPAQTDVNTKQRVTEVVMHELAHQWFGNLVTMDFWDGLWLNEGFATWMSWYACDSLYPDWKVWESYVADSLQLALSLDSLRSSHPIEVPVKRADEINQIFDAISYSKGSSLLKMISRWLGEDVFISGVSLYLKKHMWGNTQTSDLWEALAEVSGKDVVTVMDIWTKKIGFPVVRVEENESTLTLTQNRFLATADVKPEEDETLYPVFLGLKTSSGTDESLVLDKRSRELKLDISDDFYKLNADSAGVYRTAYSPERWTKLGQAGVSGKLSVEDRVGLVSDAASLAACGFIGSTDFLNLVKSWASESNYVVWESSLANILKIKMALMFEDPSINEALNAFCVELVSPKLEQVGWEFSKDDSFADQQLKSLLFGSAAANGHKKVIEFVFKAFDAYVAGDKSAINPNLRAAIYNTVARLGGIETYEKLYHIYTHPNSVEEKIAALRALGRFEQEEILDKVTALLLQTNIVKSQDIYIPMQGMRAHKRGVEKLWSWFTANWDGIYQLLPPGLSMLGSVVTIASSGFTKENQKEEVRSFFEDKNTKGFDSNLAQSLDMITAKANWATRDASKIKEWLKEGKYYQ